MKKMDPLYIQVAVGAVCLCFMIGLGTTGLSFFIAPVCSALSLERSAFTMHTTILTLVGMVATPLLSGRIKQIGVRRLAWFTMVWGGACLLGFSFAQNLLWFYLLAALYGMFMTATTMTMAIVIVNTWFVMAKSFILGVVLSGSSICATLLSMILPGFIGSFGWRNGYRLVAVLWVVLGAVAALLLRNDPADVGLPPYGATKAVTTGDVNELPGLLYKQAVRTAPFWLYIAGTFLAGLAIAFYSHVPAYLASTPFSGLAALLMTVYSVSMLVGQLTEGFLFDCLPLPVLFCLLYGILSVGILLAGSNSLPFLVIGIVLFSLGLAATGLMPSAALTDMFGPRDFAAIYGSAAIGSSLGTSFGAPLWGLVYDILGSYRWGMRLAPLLLISCMLVLQLAAQLAKKQVR